MGTAAPRRTRFGWDGLAVRFAMRGAAALLILGIALHMQLESVIRRRALAETVRSTTVVESLGLAPRILSADLRRGMNASTIALFDSVMKKTKAAGTVQQIKIFNAEHEVVYSDDHALIGRRMASDELVSALAGKTIADTGHIDDGSSAVPLLEVYAPLHLAGDQPGSPSGAFEIYLPYDSVQEAVAADTRKLAGILVLGLTGVFIALFSIVRLASRRLHAEHERNRHQALHDSLTGLPNRSLLFDRIGQAVAASARDGSVPVVMVLDLDRFKEVNDTLGHHNGDRLLIEVARRLEGALRSADTVSRLGGDEFALLLPSCVGAPRAIEIAKSLLTVLGDPFDLDGLSISVEGSIGIAVAPDDGETPEELLQRADVAMYLAKTTRVGVSLYDASQDDYSPDRLALLGSLRESVAARELTVHYQPKADIGTGHVLGVEALARWSHPLHGDVPPDVFIPLAEHTTLIGPLTELVLDTSLSELVRWQAIGHDLSLAVNISMRNLQDEEFPFLVGELLSRHGVAPERLTLEITETALMHDPELGLRIVGRLRALGVELSIDDYGTGYSSLAYLQQLTVNELKIDRHFIANLTTSESDRLIVKSTAELGRNLGLRVVAEGVETREAWEALRTLGCDAFQGYVLARPVPGDDFLVWLSEYSRDREPLG